MSRPGLALCLLSACCALGCNDRSHTEAVDVARPESRGPSLLEEGAYQHAFRQLSVRAGPDAEVLELDLQPHRIVLWARDPQMRERVLQHVFEGGKVQPPVPVRLLGTGTLEDNLFPMSEVTWAKVPGVAQAAVKDVDPASGRVSHVLVRRNLPHDSAVRIRAYVSSPIRDGYLDADARGNVLPGG